MKNSIQGIIIAIILSLTLTSCEQSWGDLVYTNLFSYGETGCRGRLGGIKDGPTTLYLPYPSGEEYTVSQTWFGTYSHNYDGREHALDFPMDVNDIITPVAAGRVIKVKEDSDTNCSSNCPHANFVLIDHGSGVIGRYVHFCQYCVNVVAGDMVNSATNIGGAGNTGWSTAPHLHFELVDWEENCSVRYGFVENSGSLEPLVKGNSYTSANAGVTSYTPSQIGGNTFVSVGVELTSTFDWYVNAGDTLLIVGSLTSQAQAEGHDSIAIFLIDSQNNVAPGTSTIEFASASPSFNVSYTVPAVAPGEYYISISKSKNESYWYMNPPYLVVY